MPCQLLNHHYADVDEKNRYRCGVVRSDEKVPDRESAILNLCCNGYSLTGGDLTVNCWMRYWGRRWMAVISPLRTRNGRCHLFHSGPGSHASREERETVGRRACPPSPRRPSKGCGTGDFTDRKISHAKDSKFQTTMTPEQRRGWPGLSVSRRPKQYHAGPQLRLSGRFKTQSRLQL